jgi:hypothetical protein
MTPRENFLAVLRHQRPQWIPIPTHVDPYNQPSQEGMDPVLREKLKKVEWSDESMVTFSRWLGLDIADFVGQPLSCQRRKVIVDEKVEGPDHITVWHTPAGELREIRRETREDGTSYMVEHLIKGPEDLPALATVFEDEVWEFDEAVARRMAGRRALIGDDGILMLALPGTPLGMMYRIYCTVETLAYLWVDARPELDQLFEIMERNYRRQYELAARLAADALIGMDDTSTTVISPAMFEACNLALTDRRADIAHAAGMYYFHHSCGLIRDLLPLYRQTRMDAIHAFTTPPIGNVTIAEGRRSLGDRITIITSPYVMADTRWDPVAVRESLRHEFAQAGAGDHFIMGLAAYPHRTMAQTKFVADCCREFGKLS